jgi:hypothetical protein
MANEGSTKPTYSELEAENLRVRGLLQRQWIGIESAPKTGEHILVAVFDGGIGFGTCGGKKQAWAGVVHYWEHDEPGWYMSTALAAHYHAISRRSPGRLIAYWGAGGVSLSSPPPKCPECKAALGTHHVEPCRFWGQVLPSECSPELLPTQLPKEK